MIKWYFTLIIGTGSLVIGYLVGRQRAREILREAERLMSEMNMIIKEAEALNDQTKEMLDEQ